MGRHPDRGEHVLHFVKMQALGNDFIVLDGSQWPEADWPGVSRVLCQRRFGIGSDGLMVVKHRPGRRSLVRMFDPDGCEDFCGNGTRCAAVFLYEKRLVTGSEFTIDTLSGPREVRLILSERRAEGAAVAMGRAQFAPERLPAHLPGDCVLQHPLQTHGRTFTICTVSTGTTHTILWQDEWPGDEEFLLWSPRIENHPAFPERTSVLWAVAVSRERIRIRIWERGGVGESLACGTGACAAAAVGRRLGLTADAVTVESKGGELSVRIDPAGQTWLTGPARTVFEGYVDRRKAAC